MASTVFTAQLKEASLDGLVPNTKTSGTAVTSITIVEHEEELTITCTTP